MRLLLFIFCLLGCTNDTPQEEDCDPPLIPYEEDSRLAFQHLQAIGSHNSYHVETTNGQIEEWEYTHDAISVQLASQGVRQLELDLHYVDGLDRFEVLHVPVLDPGTTCADLAACLQEIADFSTASPAHHPIMVLLEFKIAFDAEKADDWIQRVEDDLLNVLGRERLVLPDDVQGDHPNLRSAIENDGWPTLGDLRGKTMVVLHDGGALRDHYTAVDSPHQNLLFPDAGGDESLDFSAVHTLNDPFSSSSHISRLVMKNHLVRTRADSDLYEARAQDNSRYLAALDSGAQFISTDFAVASEDFNYWVHIPDGTPSRCNPLNAPGFCESEHIEDPDKMRPCD